MQAEKNWFYQGSPNELCDNKTVKIFSNFPNFTTNLRSGDPTYL